MSRKPMTFDVDRSPPTPAELAAKPSAQRKQQIGARISAATYRQLKARAALDGVTVQTLIEKAVEQFLAARPQA
jgi:predicted DNA binding CopG/RHH family protein